MKRVPYCLLVTCTFVFVACYVVAQFSFTLATILAMLGPAIGIVAGHMDVVRIFDL